MSKFLPAHLVELSLGNDIAALPIVAAIESDKNPAGIESAHRRDGIFRGSAEAKPENVHRRAEFLHLQSGFLADHRGPAVRPDGKVGADFDLAIRSLRADSRNAGRFFDEAGYFCLHAQFEAGITRGFFGQEVKKIPLRHERDKAAAGRQVAKVGNR